MKTKTKQNKKIQSFNEQHFQPNSQHINENYHIGISDLGMKQHTLILKKEESKHILIQMIQQPKLISYIYKKKKKMQNNPQITVKKIKK